MEDEMINFLLAYTIVVVSLTYCYLVASRISKGTKRLVTLLPIISIFTYVPLLLSSVTLQLYFGLSLAWLANFKLILFAFGKDSTLSVNPSMSLFHFILLHTTPIKIKQTGKTVSSQSSKSTKISASWLNPVVWCIMIQLHRSYKQQTTIRHPTIIPLLYAFRMVFCIQFFWEFIGAIARLLVGQEIEQQFNNPFSATSIQDFWGRRWNLMFSDVLRSAIHEPSRKLFSRIMGRRWALHPALVVTFLTSGLLHELTYFYATRAMPTWEVTLFFLIHGVCVGIEIELKRKALERGWTLHPSISNVLTVGFFISTSFLCFAEVINCGADEREIDEYIALGDYIKNVMYRPI